MRDVTVGGGGSVYVTDDAGIVHRYRDGRLVRLLGGPIGSVTLNTPRGLAATPDGALYVADMLNDRVLRYEVNGSVTVINGSIHMPNDMATDTRGVPHVASSDGRVYQVVDTTLQVVFDIRSVRTRAEQQNEGILFIAFTPDNDLIVADELRSMIWRVNRGVATRVLGNGTAVSSPDGVPADRATIASPWGVAVLPDYRLLVSESGRIRVAQLARH